MPCKCDSPRTGAAAIDTLIFVDVDGVLNVGIEDPGNSAVDFTLANVQRALRMQDVPGECSAKDIVERLIATYNREVGHGEGSTYAKFIPTSSAGASEKLIHRLAQLIRLAGDDCTVVLSSSWRHPKHAKRVEQLEQILSTCLGQTFVFHERTALVADSRPEDRLRTIGDFLAGRSHEFSKPQRKLRALVLEDFNIHPLDGWLCDGWSMNSAAAVEKYLHGRIPARGGASVKLVHTFGSWTTDSGLLVRVGTGLTRERFREASTFLSGDPCPSCAPQADAKAAPDADDLITNISGVQSITKASQLIKEYLAQKVCMYTQVPQLLRGRSHV